MSQQSSVAQPIDNDQGSGVDGFTVTEIAPGHYRFFQRQTLSAPSGHVWATVRNFQQFVKILLPTATFDWVEGGNPGTVPSRYRISLGDGSVVEEITHRDDQAQVIRYHLVVPGLGLQTYLGEIKLFSLDARQTRIEYARDLTLDAGGDVTPLRGLAAQEMVALTEHFAKGA